MELINPKQIIVDSQIAIIIEASDNVDIAVFSPLDGFQTVRDISYVYWNWWALN